MSEQRAEYHYEGKEQARKKQLDEDQACAILQAIMTKYPKVLQKVPKNIPKCAE